MGIGARCSVSCLSAVGQKKLVAFKQSLHLETAGDEKAVRMAGQYDPRKEIVVLVDDGRGGSSVYQVGKEQFRGVG